MMRQVILLLGGFWAGLCAPTLAGWPMYGGTAGRTGQTTEALTHDLNLAWVHHSPHAPQPAWPSSERMTFDRAAQPVAADGRVFYGNSVDGLLYALDQATGRVVWTFTADGPIRFAPVRWRDRLFVASDDGFLYALTAQDGGLLWKRRGGPDHSAVLGNQRLVSRWPARGGPVVVDDVVYFAAGIWPSEGIYLYALDAQSGEVRWCNDDSGGLYLPQPHGGANAFSGVSAQGYLVAAGDVLLVPTGRAVPAAFDRRTGELKYFHLQRYGQDGSAAVAADGPWMFNSGQAFRADTGDKLFSLGPGPLVVAKDFVVRGTAAGIDVGQVVAAQQTDRKGQPVDTWIWQPQYRIPDVAAEAALILAGDQLVCGSQGRVQMLDLDTRQTVWSADVEGTAYGLATADGCLLVSTDRGRIYGFRPSGSAGAAAPAAADPAPPQASGEAADPVRAQAAEAILQQAGVREGYCVDLGCGDGALACELAKRSNLQIYAVDDDPAMVVQARRRLTEAGVYGSRVIVHQRAPGDTGYPSGFADLIVSSRRLDQPGASRPGDGAAAEDRELDRLARPYGGAICVGRHEALTVRRRGEPSGAGRWTHQYADAANTSNSGDALSPGLLGMRWFREVDVELPSRHGRAPAPLCDEGRLFHAGLDGIVALDAFNGRELWRHPIPGLLAAYDGDELMGTAGTGGTLCLHAGSVYVRDKRRCLRLDAATGKELGEFRTPSQPDGRPGTWGYLAAAEGTLFGGVADDEHIVTYRYQKTTGDMTQLLTESRSLFALDARTGHLRWQYPAEHSLRHNAIAISEGRVFLIDRPLALFDREKKPETKEQALGRLLALDVQTGQVLWQRDDEIYGTLLAAGGPQGVLLMSYQPTRFRLDSELGGRMAAFRMSDGERLWDVKADYQSRPLINGAVVYAQGGAWNLLTGQSVPFEFQRSYGCGILATSQNLLLFRSATLGYFDLQSGRLANYGGIRPGCWINAIPASGLVLLPDASARCRCSYLNQAWIALAPASENEPPK